MALKAQAIQTTRHRSPLFHYVERTAFFVVVTAVVVGTLFPLYWMFVTSARALEENGEFPPSIFPHAWNWLPYSAVFTEYPLAAWLYHSLEVGMLVTVIVLFFSTLAAYALSALHWA